MRALVTGGTGRVGSAIASELEREGWSVLAVGRADGDVSVVEEARGLVERAVSQLGGLDLLVNAAGEGFAPRAAEELTEADWEKYDGYTPTFKHPNLSNRELRYLLGAAYKRFYMRPSYLANFLKIQNGAVRDWVSRMDRRVNDRHSREAIPRLRQTSQFKWQRGHLAPRH